MSFSFRGRLLFFKTMVSTKLKYEKNPHFHLAVQVAPAQYRSFRFPTKDACFHINNKREKIKCKDKENSREITEKVYKKEPRTVVGKMPLFCWTQCLCSDVPFEMPLGQLLNGDRVNLAVRLEEDGLVGVDVKAKVFVVVQDITHARGVAVCVEIRLFILILMESSHHDVDRVACVLNERGQTNLRVYGRTVPAVASTEADRIVGSAVLVGHTGRGMFRVEQDGHANAVRGKDHGLDMGPGRTVGCEADKLDLVSQLVEVQVGPAAVGPVGHKGSPQTGVDVDELCVALPQVVGPQNLADSAHIVASIVAVDNANIVPVGQKTGNVSLAIKDEDKVGGAVEANLDKVGEIFAAKRGLGVDVGDERVVWL